MTTPIILPLHDDDLLRQCEVQTFRSGGKGGQHQNKVESGVRLLHRPSGLVVESREERSQYLNKLRCIKKLRRKVAVLNYRAPARISTRVSAATKAKASMMKKRHSERKQLRRKPVITD
jgi:protein subunit release factor B